MTQRELAEVSGLRQSNISAIENDRRLPSADTLNRLLVACGFELAAKAGDRVIYGPLPKAGWFPDDDAPPRTPADPPDRPPTTFASDEERARALTALLELADATRGR